MHDNRSILRIKNMEIEHKNIFIIIIAFSVVLFCLLIMQIFLNVYFKPTEIIPYGGYGISGEEITKNLLNKDFEDGNDSKIQAIEVAEQTGLFEKLKKYYVGEEKKEEINIEYPIILKENNTIYNFKGNTLITADYQQITGFQRSMISNGELYNSGDLLRTDEKNYILLKTNEDTYINLKEIKINTQYNEYNLPLNSIIYFSEEYMAYYTLKDGYFEYTKIADIDNNSKVKINDSEISYYDFLVKLGIIKVENKNQEEIKQEDETTPEVTKEENTIQNTTIKKNEVKEENTTIQEEKDETSGDGTANVIKYVKPEVKVDSFETGVYTASSSVLIIDPTSQIKSPINFVITNNGNTFLKKSITSSGKFQFVGFFPDQEYTITASYVYLNEDGEKIEKKFFEQTVHTKTIDSLNTIDLSYETGKIYPKKIIINNLKITSDLTDEALKGIKKIEIIIGDVVYKIPTSNIQKLLNGKEITIETQENIPSNSNIKFEINIYDTQENKLKANNAEGQTRTSKVAPTVEVKVTKQDVSLVTLKINIKNEDKVDISNYRYVLKDSKGNILKQEFLSTNQTRLDFTDLDPEQSFTIQFYGDFDLNDENGNQKDQLLTNATFTSVPLSILGYLNMKAEVKDIKKDSITINALINQDRTDARLINILQEIYVTIYEKATNNSIQTITIGKEEVEALKAGGNKDLTFSNLNSKTEYYIVMKCKIQQGNTQKEINVIQPLNSIITLKKPAQILIKNQFVTGSMIDFDVQALDIDGASLDGTIRMEIRDEKGKLIKIETIKTNQDFQRLTYEKLDAKQNYIISFYANEYNEGSDATTFKSNYLVREIKIYTEPGISGEIGINNLLRNKTGKNLIDVKSEVKWYSACFNSSNYFGKTYDERDGTLRLVAGKSGYSQYYTYNLQEYTGKTVTISFKAKLDEYSSNMAVYLQNSKTGANRTKITGLSQNNWIDYSATVQLDSSGYIGLFLQSAGNIDEQAILIQELQVELSSKKTAYEEYKYNLGAEININLTDLRSEIATNDYYITILKNNEEVSTERFEEIDDTRKVVDSVKKYNLDENANYEIQLKVKIRDRYYVIDNMTFSTSGEIKGIRNRDDFLQIQPYGNYLVLKDLDLTGTTGATLRFGSYYGFFGTIDFQGHKMLTDGTSGESIFHIIEKTGVIKNIILNIDLNNSVERWWERGRLCYVNRGIIQNIDLNLVGCTQVPNNCLSLLGYSNEGTGILENFVIDLKVPLYTARYTSTAFLYNSGTIRNGYLYGCNIETPFSIALGQDRAIGALTYYVDKGTVENVYSLVNITSMQQSDAVERYSNLVYINNRGFVKNVYSVGSGTLDDLTYGPTVTYDWASKTINAYYFDTKTFKNSYNLKSTKLSLYDVGFQNSLINLSNQFNVTQLVEQNYYPQIKQSRKMPNQEFISLPETTDKDLVDIMSMDVIESQDDYAKVQLNVNNPEGEQITNVKIKNLTTKILSQEYSDGKSKVLVELKNPIEYVSRYSILSITSKGATNKPYTRTFEENERFIKIDFYKDVSTIDEWKNINNSLSENYKLKQDLDFINENSDVLIRGQYLGKLDGENHTIKNIKVPDSIANAALFYNLNGELRNLNIQNYSNETKFSTYVGIIALAYSNTTIDNVHAKDVFLSCNVENGTNRTGGLIAYGSQVIIQNSSITNLNVNIDGYLNNTMIGGMAGEAYNVKIYNSYMQNLKINAKGVLIYYGIGGIIGREGDSGGLIQYCYATGNITTDAEQVGGLYGFTSSAVKNNYALVNIESKTDYLGEIGGYDNSYNTIRNLSLGNIYSEKTSDYISRIRGNAKNALKNYSYKKQLVNGLESNDFLGADEFISYDELKQKSTYIDKVYFEDEFNYDGLEKGILPKVNKTDGSGLVAGQVDNKLYSGEFNIDSIETEKQDVNTLLARIVIDNPTNIQITGVNIEYIKIDEQTIVNKDGKTYVTIKGTHERAYDSYQLNQIKYMENNVEKTMAKQSRISVQFFNEINDITDWDKLDSTTAQNYRLNTDLDFSNYPNPKTNVSIGRLEAEGTGHTIKNLTTTINGYSKGFIKEIKSSLVNVTFDNINITNTGSGSYTGLIVRNIATIDKTNFKNITVTAKKMSYVGSIASNSSLSITNVSLDTINMYGTDYVSGFVAKSDSGVYNGITGNNITIVSTGTYVGGLFGGISGRKPYRNQNFKVTNSNISAVGDYVGGILGYGRASYFTVTDTTVKGRNYVGGICGSVEYSGGQNITFMVTGCSIISTGSYCGGVAGVLDYTAYAYVQNTTLTGVSYVGGIAGTLSRSLVVSGVNHCTITATGSYIGGIVGSFGSWEVGRCDCTDTTIKGAVGVGGAVGYFRSGTVDRCYISAEISASANGAGGLIGCLDNTYMTGASYTSAIYENYVVGTKVTSPSKTGGLIGNMIDTIYNSRYYHNNFVEAKIYSTTRLRSLGIGSMPSEYNNMLAFYVYKYSTINDEYITTENDRIPISQYLSTNDLKVASTYYSKIGINSSILNFGGLSSGKYPILAGVSYQTQVDIPNDSTINASLGATSQLGMSLKSSSNINNNLPDVKVYPISKNEINIEFSKISNNMKFSIKANNETIEEGKAERLVYTYKYDFKTTMELTISEGNDEKTIEIKPEEYVNKQSIVNDKCYYLDESSLKCNDDTVDGSFVNLYGIYALSTDGRVYNLQTNTYENEKTEKIEKTSEGKSIEKEQYNGKQIKTYALYSEITQDNKTSTRDDQIFVRDNKLFFIDVNINKSTNGQIIGIYNEKEYETVLRKDGTLFNIKENIKYPDDFENKDIEQIVTNNSTENPLVMIYYKNKKVICFNFITGEEKFNNNVKKDVSLIDYITEGFNINTISKNIATTNNEQYEESKELKQKLEQMPISKLLTSTISSNQSNTNTESQLNLENNGQNVSNNNTQLPGVKENVSSNNQEKTDASVSKENTSTSMDKDINYITVYNANNNTYEIYKEEELTKVDDESPISENDKIESNSQIKAYYETSQSSKVNEEQNKGIIWVFLSVVGIIGFLAILKVVLIKKNSKSEN